MVISERKVIVGIPVNREDIPQYHIRRVTAHDFYGEFGAHRRVTGIMTVETPDIVSLRGESRFSDKHFYSKDQINKLGIQTIEQRGEKRPFRKTGVVWSKE